MIIADWHDIAHCVALEVHVTSFKSKEVGNKKSKDAFMFLCADGSWKQEGHAQGLTLRHQRVESFDSGRVPSTLGGARRRHFTAREKSWE